MAWWRAECPVRPSEQAWIEESLDWMVPAFGRARLPWARYVDANPRAFLKGGLRFLDETARS